MDDLRVIAELLGVGDKELNSALTTMVSGMGKA